MHNGNAPIADFAVSYRLSVSLNKVGDTLTATVEPADAKVTYKWTINGKGAVTTATYTVPADANSGDAIKLVVTDADGETAEDTVYVGGFTILAVEPTTDQTNNGYKYIRAYFSGSLNSLEPEDIVIRDKKTNQLYSVDTVKLSADGTYADITLFGSVLEGGTMFLSGGTEYVMTIAKDGSVDSYEFELPNFSSDMLVTKVNLKDGKVTLGRTDRTNAGTAIGEFEVGDVFADNLGTLVGRTVNVGVNSDNEIESINANDAEVVYGVMKYVEKGEAAGTPEAKDYFQDVVTETKYYLSHESAKASKINTTKVINVVDGADMLDTPDLTDGAVYSYAKLVLNPNGTVSCAVLDGDAWDDYMRVVTVDDTLVTESTANAFDFDGYTIEKDGEYITTDKLEEDDIIYFEGTNKFAEVFSIVVDGTPSGINSTSIKIDGVSYKWNNLDHATDVRYYDDGDEAYLPLNATKGNVDAQKYLESLDSEIGVTAYLNRLGDIVYIDGVVTGTSATTDEYYVTTSAAAGYTQALNSYIKFKVSDGTEQTIEIPVSQIKKFNGVAGKMTGEAGTEDDGSDYEFTFDATADEDDATASFTADEAKDLITSGELVKLTKDSTGKIIGITLVDNVTDGADIVKTTVDFAVDIDGKGKAVLKPSSSKVETDDGMIVKLTDDTNIWVHTVKGTKTTVSKVKFEDYTKTTLDLAAAETMKVFTKGSSVTDILILETITDDVSNAFEIADKSSAEGIVISYTAKKNADGDANYIDTITIMEIDGTQVEYEASVENLAIPNEGDYIELTLDKNTGEIVGVASNVWSYIDWLDTAKTYTKLTQLECEDGTSVQADKTALVVKRSYNTDGSAKYTKTTMNQINTSSKEMVVQIHEKYYNSDDAVVFADFIVVEEDPDAEAVAEAGQEYLRLAGMTFTVANPTDAASTITIEDANGDAVTETVTVTSSDDTKGGANAAGGVVTTTYTDDGQVVLTITVEGADGHYKRVVTWVYTLETDVDTSSLATAAASDAIEEA